jgi:hypothetical protein
MTRLVDALGGRHGRLLQWGSAIRLLSLPQGLKETYDGQRAHVLPSLFQERNQVVDGQHDVTDQLVLSHTDVSDGDTQAENLLELELDGALDVIDLVGQVLGVGDGSRELSKFGETGSEETRDLLDQLLGGDEGIVFASHLLDELLVLVELLQVVDGHELDTVVLGTVDIVLVTEDAVDACALER